MILLASANKSILFHWEQAILDFSTLSICHHFDSLCDKLKHTDPEILLLDYELPGFNHSRSILDIINLHKNLKIIVFNPELPGETEWKVYAAGEVFNVPGNSEFNLQVAEPTSYLCRYL